MDYDAKICDDFHSLNITLKQVGNVPADPVLKDGLYSNDKITTNYQLSLIDVWNKSVLNKIVKTFDSYMDCVSKSSESPETNCPRLPHDQCTAGFKNNEMSISLKQSHHLLFDFQCFQLPKYQNQRQRRYITKKNKKCCADLPPNMICHGCKQIVKNKKMVIKVVCPPGAVCLGSQTIIGTGTGGKNKKAINIAHTGNILVARTRQSMVTHSSDDVERLIHGKVISKALAMILKGYVQ